MKSKLELLNLIKSYVEVNYNPNAVNFEILCDEAYDDSEVVIAKKSSLSTQYGVDYGNIPPALRDLRKKLKSTWCSEVFWIIDENEYKDSEVYKRAGISKQTFSKFRKDINYQPKRDTALQMCIGLKLNLDKTIDLLSKAGYGLSAASERDLVIKYFIENRKYNIYDINDVLYDLGLDEFNIIENV